MDNSQQLSCLQAENAAEVSDACKNWRDCLQETVGMEEKVKTMLIASGLDGGMSSEDTPVEHLDRCIDPTSADPESWECDCYAEAHEACSRVDVDNTDVECMRAHYCNFDQVC